MGTRSKRIGWSLLTLTHTTHIYITWIFFSKILSHPFFLFFSIGFSFIWTSSSIYFQNSNWIKLSQGPRLPQSTKHFLFQQGSSEIQCRSNGQWVRSGWGTIDVGSRNVTHRVQVGSKPWIPPTESFLCNHYPIQMPPLGPWTIQPSTIKHKYLKHVWQRSLEQWNSMYGWYLLMVIYF